LCNYSESYWRTPRTSGWTAAMAAVLLPPGRPFWGGNATMMSDYDAQLMNEQLQKMDGAIESFLTSYNTHRGSDKQRTVIFLPGGMGSELTRATTRFSGAPGGNYDYETLWVDLAKIFLDEGALLLQMNGNEDDNRQFIVANGPL